MQVDKGPQELGQGAKELLAGDGAASGAWPTSHGGPGAETVKPGTLAEPSRHEEARNEQTTRRDGSL